MRLLDKFTIRFQPYKERFREWINTTRGTIIYLVVTMGIYTVAFIFTAPLRAPKPEPQSVSWIAETLRKHGQPEMVEIRYPKPATTEDVEPFDFTKLD